MNNDDATARALASIEETLQGFSSPMVGDEKKKQQQQQQLQKDEYPKSSTKIRDGSNYGMDAMEWMTEELRHAPKPQQVPVWKTPRRTPMMERAGTPIMSNSSRSTPKASQPSTTTTTPGSGASRSRYGLIDGDDDDDDDDSDSDDDDVFGTLREDPPLPVETPLQRKFKTASAPRSSSSPVTGSAAKPARLSRRLSAPLGTTATTATPLKQNVFRRYHDALWDYLFAKKSLSNRMELERKERALVAEAARNDESNSYGNNNSALLAMMDMEDEGDGISETLARQECKAEVDFCLILCKIGHGLAAVSTEGNSSSSGNEESMEEGHFWDLLATLRRLSLSALIWDQDATSMTQHASAQSFYLNQLTTRTDATPKEIIDVLSGSGGGGGESDARQSSSSSSSPPLVLKRKQELLKWIQSCLAIESRELKTKLRTSGTIPCLGHPDVDPPPLVSEMDSGNLQTMFRICLALFLEGRSSEARNVARTRGQPLRAAQWWGGEPYGYASKLRDDTKSVEELPVGNPHRFLWKRTVWAAGRKLLLKQTTTQMPQTQQRGSVWGYQQPQQPFSSSSIGYEEAAIYSILSDDVQNALENPCIRSSWTRSLCVMLLGVQGRIHDEVLQRHNSYQRRRGTVFPGDQYESQEHEQLMHTSNLATMTEAAMAEQLANNPFLKQQEQQQRERRHRGNNSQRFPYKSAILAFVVGRSGILDLCAREVARVVAELREVARRREDNESDGNADDEYVHQDWEGVRFLTHLTLFLHSLQDSSTPISCDGIYDQKNAILFEYVQYLESRPDLWHMITLYASLLPHSTVLEYYPTVLARVLDDTERHTMRGQIRDLMPELELPLLRQVVRRSLSAPHTGDDEVDAIKCNSLQWLLLYDPHPEDALICANILLREFFRDTEEDKTAMAATFLREYLSEDFLETVQDAFAYRKQDGGGGATGGGDDGRPSEARVNNAVAEHLAFGSYLEAYGIFERWKDTLQQATPAIAGADPDDSRLVYANLNETEKAVADATRLRAKIRANRQQLSSVVTAADDARSAWENVLAHPGGWLGADDDELQPRERDDEERARKRDLESIRSQHLVLAANLYHQVCADTAGWISATLQAAEAEGIPRDEILRRVRSSSSSSAAAARDAKSSGDDDDDPHTPERWYRHAEDLAVLVASDKHGIHKAFGPSDLQELVTKLAETSVAKLMNTTNNNNNGYISGSGKSS